MFSDQAPRMPCMYASRPGTGPAPFLGPWPLGSLAQSMHKSVVHAQEISCVYTRDSFVYTQSMYQCNLCCYALELCGTMQNYTKLCETIRNYAKLYETMRNYTKLYETMRNYAKLCETIRNYAKLCETMQNYAKLNDFRRFVENWTPNSEQMCLFARACA